MHCQSPRFTNFNLLICVKCQIFSVQSNKYDIKAIKRILNTAKEYFEQLKATHDGTDPAEQ
jgi:hypothetical protein